MLMFVGFKCLVVCYTLVLLILFARCVCFDLVMLFCCELVPVCLACLPCICCLALYVI